MDPIPAAGIFSTEQLDFAVRFKDCISSYKVLGLFVLPGEPVDVEIVRSSEEKSAFKLLADGREIPAVSDGRWSWVAPGSKGLHVLTVQPSSQSSAMTFNAFVMLPFSSLKEGKINGYRIGRYPDHPKNNRPSYLLPRGFVEVTPELESVRVSPHFRLGQFLCKQGGDYPKYVILLERLLLKLELILGKVNHEGVRAETFNVMSGYRTPAYNTAIGNVQFSMHQWGGAADIFVDEAPRDGMMDDLDGDGAIDVKDAIVLHHLVERMEDTEFETPLSGGLGLYGKSSSHGPFIHVDVRGFRARWESVGPS